MKRSLLASALALVAVACQGSGQQINDHWNADSIAPRAGRFFLGYDAQKDGDYRDFAWERKQHINLTLRRHLFHHNPDNPNHPDVAARQRPLNSLLPDPVSFIHLEGLLIGFATWTGTGSFIPIPVDSLIGVLAPGGRDEFMDGITDFAGGSIGAVTSTFAHKWVKPGIAGTVTMFHRLVD
ncbi:MAG: hypothetical protein O2816_08215 [Planctomycetota bacterium]|nr:hypothetical protein [Planctomycetota bacterium]